MSASERSERIASAGDCVSGDGSEAYRSNRSIAPRLLFPFLTTRTKGHALRLRTVLTIALFAVVGAVTLSSCGAFVSLSAHVKDQSDEVPITPLIEDELTQELARHFGLMSLFAHAVYRDDLKRCGRLDLSCAYQSQKAVGLIDYGMPGLDEHGGRWRRWESRGDAACVDEDGLFYETYVYINEKGQMERAVIAFRGTQNERGEAWADWSTNLAPIFGLEPHQYRLARQRLDVLIPKLKAKLAQTDPKTREDKIRLYATGHSLGGGLAQQTAFLSKDVRAVFAFNSSPVTNWTQLRLMGKIKNAYPTIYRVSHQGEALEGIRNLFALYSGSRYRRHDLTTQIYRHELISGHNMKILACTFAALIADPKSKIDEARHRYSKKSAASLFEAKNSIPICDPAFREILQLPEAKKIELTVKVALEKSKSEPKPRYCEMLEQSAASTASMEISPSD